MTNYGTLAILAAPKLSAAQRHFLQALETITPGEDGRREAVTEWLAILAGQSVTTAARVRRALTASGDLDYRPATGRGQKGSYLILTTGVEDHHGGPSVNYPKVRKIQEAELARRREGRRKDRPNADDLSEHPKGSRSLATFPEPGKVVKDPPERSSNAPRKGRHRNPATSGNASTALEPIALQPSALPAAAPDPRTILAGLLDGQDDEDRLTEFILATLKPKRPDLAGYLLSQIGKDGGSALMAWARRTLNARDGPAPRPGPRRAPPCDDCGKPYTTGQLADDEFYRKAMAGTAGRVHPQKAGS
jgi:hypothetical protein